MSVQRSASVLALIIFLIILLVPISYASSPSGSYVAALQIAQRKAERQRLAQEIANTPATASHSAHSGYARAIGRKYKVGETWDVIAWRLDRPISRMTNQEEHLRTLVRESGIFRYEVLSLSSDASPNITLRVTQIEGDNVRKVDPQVDHLILTLTDQMVEKQKVISFVDRPNPVAVSHQGLRSGELQTLLEVFPLDVPEVLTAERAMIRQLPELPQKVQEFVANTGFKPDFSQSTWYLQDDFFGRPIEALWERESPWPTYLRTSNGIALLIRRGDL